MTFLRVLTSRVRALFVAPQLDRDLEDELRSHIEMETEANVRRGMTPAEARRRALLEFGGVAQTAEIYREARAVAWVEARLQDIRSRAARISTEPLVSPSLRFYRWRSESE